MVKLDMVRAVVTGGGSGMGKATAEAIVHAGGKVCIVDFYQDRCEEVVAALGDAAMYGCADVADPVRAEEIVNCAVEKFGYVNVVVNCAGVGSGVRILPREGGVFPLETFRRVLDINLIGTFNYLCYCALAMSNAPENEDGERGVIINTSSNAYNSGQIGQAAYSASKAAIEGLTLPIARELARTGIRINTIVPGRINTNMSGVDRLGAPPPTGPRRERPADYVEPASKDFIFPFRMGYASEYATLALQIISNTLMNGGSYALDGAMRMSPRW